MEVPHELPAARYPDQLYRMRMNRYRGKRLRIGVVAVDEAAMVEGVRVLEGPAHVWVELTDEQAREVGLPPDQDRQMVSLPDTASLTVPARWLYPADAQRPPTHREMGHSPW